MKRSLAHGGQGQGDRLTQLSKQTDKKIDRLDEEIGNMILLSAITLEGALFTDVIKKNGLSLLILKI